jgi:hypothetical protein
VSVAWVVGLSLAIATLYQAALAVFAWPAFAAPRRRRALAIGLCALAAPGYGYLLSDLGRYDVLNYALCLVALVASRAAGRFPYPFFLALGAGMLLIHEAALLLAVPVLFVGHLEAEGRLCWLWDRRRLGDLAIRLAPLAALFAAIALFGESDLTLRELMPRLAAHSEVPPSAQSAYVLVRGLDSNVAQLLGREDRIALSDGLHGPPLGGVVFDDFWGILPIVLLQLGLTLALLGGVPAERRRPILAAVLLCFLAPFPLMLIGIDWDRWAALASAHCATLGLLFARELPGRFEAPLSRGLALLAALFVILAASKSYTMQGARWKSAESPVAGVERFLVDWEMSPSWDRAFWSR